VTDYFDLVAIHYPVFNVADSFIFMGVVLMITVLLKNPTATPDPKPLGAHEPPSSAC
jgi:lipoprotein signal peptidase